MKTQAHLLRTLSVVVLLGAAALAPASAWATLGQAQSTAAKDASLMRASIKSSEQPKYRLHEIALPSGTRVREFAGPDGTVFAVAWRGPAMPDLRQTLGSYFADYIETARAPHPGHNRVQLRTPTLVIESSGHMRAFSGRAYLPQVLPGGVTVDELH